MMAGSRILITGGAGLIGSHIADQLIRERPAEIRILDNFARGRREHLAWAVANGPVKVIEGDIRDRALVRRCMDDIDIVFHEAAIGASASAEEPRLALEVLVEGSFNVVEAAVRAGVEKVVAASSTSIYGAAEEFPTTERHHPYNDRTLYGAANTFGEGLLRSFNHMFELPSLVLRYADVYGPRMENGTDAGLLTGWIDRIAAGEAPVIFGDGTETMDLVHVHDVARANIIAAKASASDTVFNVGSGHDVTASAVLKLLARIMGASDIAVEYGPERRRYRVPRRLASTRRAKEMLGFEPLVSLEQGLKTLVDWWRQRTVRDRAA